MSIYTHQVLSEAFTLKEGPLSYKVLKTCVFSLFDAVHVFFFQNEMCTQQNLALSHSLSL